MLAGPVLSTGTRHQGPCYEEKGRRIWIKSDGSDLEECLQTSKKNEWHGDVDLGDGALEEVITTYSDIHRHLVIR